MVRDIDIRDSTFANLTRQALFIEGWSETAQVTDVTIANCAFEKAANASTMTNAARIRLLNNRGLEIK